MATSPTSLKQHCSGRRLYVIALAAILAAGCSDRAAAPQRSAAPARPAAAKPAVDPLPAWNDGAAKAAIIAFVARVREWRDKEPFKSVLAGDPKVALAGARSRSCSPPLTRAIRPRSSTQS